jgi:hypothetical protein
VEASPWPQAAGPERLLSPRCCLACSKEADLGGHRCTTKTPLTESARRRAAGSTQGSLGRVPWGSSD